MLFLRLPPPPPFPTHTHARKPQCRYCFRYRYFAIKIIGAIPSHIVTIRVILNGNLNPSLSLFLYVDIARLVGIVTYDPFSGWKYTIDSERRIDRPLGGQVGGARPRSDGGIHATR